jgi:putative sigma-54 modulation protein
MRLQVKGKNLEVSDSIRRYAEEKLAKLNPQLHELTAVEVELCVEKNPSIAANQIAEATVWTKGPTLRAREASADMKASIDQLTEKLLRQIDHYHAKRRRSRHTRGNSSPAAALTGAAFTGGSMSSEDESTPQFVRTKQFPVKPMNPEEAVLQMDLLGHDFFVFRNDESHEINVIYRRRSGGYGLIEPQA